MDPVAKTQSAVNTPPDVNQTPDVQTPGSIGDTFKDKKSFLASLSAGKVLIIVEFVVCFILFCVLSFISVSPKNPRFLLFELLKQSSFIYVLVQVIGLAYYAQLSFLPKDPIVIVPVVVSIATYSMTVAMGYAQNASCDEPKRSVIFTQALKPVVMVVLGYFAATKVGFLNQGFYDLVSDGKPSQLGLWIAISFWMATAIYPSVSSAYFAIQQNSCNSDTEINIGTVKENDKRPQII